MAQTHRHHLDLINTSVLGALGCDMSVFLRYFPAAETMYEVFVALAIGLILLLWVWNLFKNFGIGGGGEAEDPVHPVHRPGLLLQPNCGPGAGHRRTPYMNIDRRASQF